MVHDEMLRVLIELAVKNGWKEYPAVLELPWETSIGRVWLYEKDAPDGSSSLVDFSFKEIIFNHDFAKAVYGPGIVHKELPHGVWSNTNHAWEYHIMMQSISDDPLKYMYENRRQQ